MSLSNSGLMAMAVLVGTASANSNPEISANDETVHDPALYKHEFFTNEDLLQTGTWAFFRF
jgi:hypothetical protein